MFKFPTKGYFTLPLFSVALIFAHHVAFILPWTMNVILYSSIPKHVPVMNHLLSCKNMCSCTVDIPGTWPWALVCLMTTLQRTHAVLTTSPPPHVFVHLIIISGCLRKTVSYQKITSPDINDVKNKKTSSYFNCFYLSFIQISTILIQFYILE